MKNIFIMDRNKRNVKKLFLIVLVLLSVRKRSYITTSKKLTDSQ